MPRARPYKPPTPSAYAQEGRLVSKILCDHMACMHSCIHHQVGREVDMARNVGTARLPAARLVPSG